MSFRDSYMTGASMIALEAAAPRAPDNDGGAVDLSFLDDNTIFDADPPPPPEPEVDDFDEDGNEKPPAEKAEGEQKPLDAAELSKRNADLQKALNRERGLRRQAQMGGQQPPQQQRQDPAPTEQQRRVAAEFVDPDKDPLGAVAQMQRLVKDFQSQQVQREQGEEAERAQNARYERIDAAFRQDETEFRRDNPDFNDAAGHYLRARAKELGVMGLEGKAVADGLHMEMRRLTASCVQRGESPAAALYSMAKDRGYAKAAPATEASGADGKKAGTNPALDRIRQGSSAQSAMSRTGSGGKRELTAATVSNIDIHSKKGGEAFDKAWDALERSARASERGGR